jgi:hypothetical protein
MTDGNEQRKPVHSGKYLSVYGRAEIKPGDILRYRSRPRHKWEILCHNHIRHAEDMAPA